MLGPVPAPLGQKPYQSDAGRGSAPIGNFNTFALQRHQDTPDAEPYLDYFTGKRPWMFSKGDLVSWQSMLQGKKVQQLDLSELEKQGAIVRRHPTQTELALLAPQLQLIRRNALARLGFNPERTILLEGDNNTDAAGHYYPTLDMKFIPVDGRRDSNALGHESMHAGLTRMRKEGMKMPGLSARGDDEERLVRLLMHAFSGDSEENRRPKVYTDWLNKVLPALQNRNQNRMDWGRSAREVNDAAGTFYRNLQEQQRLMTSGENRRYAQGGSVDSAPVYDPAVIAAIAASITEDDHA
tara:strand:+ start:122 stop:1009 length:888 start_codon:yes stop_codon:yes gene_type:complete